MDILQTIVLALIQGLSEFLPISSSAHLILVPKLGDWPDQGLAFDVVVHLGTLVAIVYYYRETIKELFIDFYHSIVKQEAVGESRLAWGVLLGTIPVGLCGLIFKDYIEANFRSIEVIAYATIVFGMLLGFAAYLNSRKKLTRNSINFTDIAFVGIMQAIALIPGTSRSGITITAGLLIGLSKQMATKFAFLLSIPVISLSAILMLLDLFGSAQSIDWSLLIIGFIVSTLSSYYTVVFFIRLLDVIGLMPFVVYRLVLGVVLLAI